MATDPLFNPFPDLAIPGPGKIEISQKLSELIIIHGGIPFFILFLWEEYSHDISKRISIVHVPCSTLGLNENCTVTMKRLKEAPPMKAFS